MVNVSDKNRKRSSLKNPMIGEDFKKLSIFDKKNIHFDLDPIEEDKLEEVIFYFRKRMKKLKRNLSNLKKNVDNH